MLFFIGLDKRLLLLRAVFFIGIGFLCIWIMTKYITDYNCFNKIFFIMMIIHNVIGWNELLPGIHRFAGLNRLDKYGQFAFNLPPRLLISMYANIIDYVIMLMLGILIASGFCTYNSLKL